MSTTDLDTVRRRLGDRYAIERELGRGGMGTVYLACDLRLDLWSPLIEFAGGAIQGGLREGAQVRAAWEVLAQQRVGVLARASLPRTLRIAKVDGHLSRQREVLMPRQLHAAISCQ